MKVLHVSPSYARRDGGPSEVLRGLLPALTARGVDWSLATTNRGVVASDADLGDLRNVQVFPAQNTGSWALSGAMAKGIGQMIKSADVVHIHYIHTFPTTIAMRLAAKFRVPYVLEPHGALTEYQLRQGYLKKILYSSIVDKRGLAKLGAAIYSSELEERESRSFLPRTKSHYMTLGVSPELRLASRSGPRNGDVLFLGRVTKKKRLDLLIAAMGLDFVGRQTRLIVAGPIDPTLPYDPVQLARDAGLGDRAIFLGQVGPEQRAQLLSSSSVFVLPSEDESFGMSVAEAMVSGCAVVCSSGVGAASSAARSQAVTIAALNPEDLARKIASVLQTRAGDEIAARGRAYALDQFTWDRAADQIIPLYEALQMSAATAARTESTR